MKIKGGFIVFIAAIFLGMLISFNINFNQIIERNLSLSAKQYKDAINEKRDLYKEVESLRENNIKTQETINKYKYDDKKQDKILDSMKLQLKDYSMITGLTEVQGPGLLIKINDGNIDLNKDTDFETKSKIFHDNDMALVLNDLRKAGAEAISINNHRVTPGSGVICNWAFLGFGDETTEYAPFYIYAIGDPEVMKTSLLEEGSHIRELIIRQLSVNIEIKENIVMPATSKIMHNEYMKEYVAN